MSRKIAFFEGWSWFKFNTWGVGLSTNLKFCTSMAKGSKLKVRKIWKPNLTFVEVTGEKLVGGPFCPLPAPILKRVKGCACDIFGSLFFKSTSTCETRKNAFCFTSKALFVLEKMFFRILDILVSWRHQMPKHKTRNTFFWISWEVNTACSWNLVSLCHITKEEVLSKNSTKTAT